MPKINEYFGFTWNLEKTNLSKYRGPQFFCSFFFLSPNIFPIATIVVFSTEILNCKIWFVAQSYLTGAEKNAYQGHLVNIKQIADKTPKIEGTWYYYLAFVHMSSLPKIIAVKRKFLRFLSMNMRLVYVNKQTCFLKNFHTIPIFQ